MPLFKPFRGVRAKSEYVKGFASIPIDKLTPKELCGKHPEVSYLQMVRPFTCSKAQDVDRNLRKVRQNFESLLSSHKLLQDNSSIYLYSQTLPDKTLYRGLLGLTSVEDFLNGKIKKHEATITKRKENYAQYLGRVEMQAEPVLLTYPANSKIEVMMDYEEKSIPDLNMTDEFGVTHKIWKIDNRLTIKQFKDVFEEIDAFYIADGHHRLGSISLNAKYKREKEKHLVGREGFNFIYSFVISNQSIKIHDYNRVVKDLNGLSPDEFLERLQTNFLIHEKEKQPYYPSQKHHIGMYLAGKFYSLHIKHNLRMKDDGLANLDHYFLEINVFQNILGMESSKNSDKIEYISGKSTVDGLQEIVELVDKKDYEVGFVIYPVSYNDLVKISDLGQKMPPKCTYIEPKLRAGLLMYDMK